MNFAGTLTRSALTYADNAAVSKGHSIVLNYAQLSNRVSKLAYSLRYSLALKKNDRVALIMKNCPEIIETIYAAWHAGLSVVPINAKLHPREFGYILEDSGAKACFATGELMESVKDAKTDAPLLDHIIEVGTSTYEKLFDGSTMPLEDLAPTDLAWLFYTSGTTGRPKGAMLSHRNIHSMTMNYLADVDTIDPNDCIIHAAPMSHGSGLYALPHIARGANNIIPESGGFDVAETVDLIQFWPQSTFLDLKYQTD